MNIYLSAALAYDRIMSFPGRFSDHIMPDKLDMLSVRFPIDRLREAFGGPAGNMAHGLALLGEKPLILASAGKDFGPYQAKLLAQGLSLAGISIWPEELTAGAYITTDHAGNQITCFHPGATDHAADYSHIAPGQPALVMVSPGNMDDMLNLPRLGRQHGFTFIADPGQAITSMSASQLMDMMRGAYALISNDYELALIQDMTGLDIPGLLTLCQTVITTLGKRGSVIKSRTGEIAVPAVRAPALDPTGAGDAFRAGLLKGLALGLDLEISARLGAVTAAFCVEGPGPQDYTFTPEAFKARLRDNFDLHIPGLFRENTD